MKNAKRLREYLLRSLAFMILLSIFSNFISASHANEYPPLPLWKTEGEEPFDHCDPRAFIVDSSSPTTAQLAHLDLTSSATEVVFAPVGPEAVGYTYNAMAYNPQDNYLYAMKDGDSSADADNLLRIGRDGQPRFVAEIPWDGGVAIAADFDDEGNMYVQTGTASVHKVNLSGDEPVLVWPSPYTTGLSIADWAYYNGALWGVHIVVNDSLRIVRAWVARIDLNGPNGYPLGPPVLGEEIVFHDSRLHFTSLFPSKNGIYGYDTRDGGLYRIDLPTNDPNDATIQHIANGRPTAGSDGAKCRNSPLGLPAEVFVEKTTASSAFVPGDTVSFTIRVENQGPHGASAITLQDPLPAGVISAAWTCTPSSEKAMCPAESGTGPIDVVLALQEAGAFVTFEVTMETDPAATAEIINTATIIVPEDFIDDPSNNTDDAIVPLEGVEFTVQKVGVLETEGSLTLPGDTIDYQVTLRNDSRVVLSNVTVSDPGPLFGDDRGTGSLTPFEPSVAILNPGEEATFTVKYTITAEDLANLAQSGGVEIVNVATGTVTTPAGVTLSEDASAIVSVSAPAIHLDKSAELINLVGEEGPNGEGIADPGDKLEYTLVVTNTGSLPLDNIVLVDTLVEDLERVSADLDTNGYLQPGRTITYKATYTLTREDMERGEVYNFATVSSTIPGFPDRPGPQHSAENIEDLTGEAKIFVQKFAQVQSADKNAPAVAGDSIVYTVRLTNQGNVTVTDVQPIDAGPTFGGQPASGVLSAFQPQSVRLAPGESAEFTATYTLTETDIDNGFGQNAVRNVATAAGRRFDGRGDLEVNSAEAFIELPGVSIVKTADVPQVARGGTVPFTIKLNAAGPHNRLNLVDTMPAGFTYVKNSARVNDTPVEPQISGRRLVFPLDVQSGQAILLRLHLAPSASVQPGLFLNYAHAELPGTGAQYGPRVSAEVEVPVEHIFDCGELLGRVFQDRNRNGAMDDHEEGVAGVRLVAVEGTTITTDAEGRFHVTCADLPSKYSGSTFLLKLDPAALPTGFRILSENPRAVRLTAGKITRINFATSVARVVRVDINSDAFLADTVQLRPEWNPRLHQLLALLRQEPSVLRLSYIDQTSDRRLATRRVDFLRDIIRQLWESNPNNYRLEIESRILTQTGQGWDDPNPISWVIVD